MEALMKFSELNLHPLLMNGIETLGFQEATPIQAEAIPLVLKGLDISGLAQTGTGKTGAFLIPLMERILRTKEMNEEQDPELKARAFDSWKAGHFVLILVPTRELAEQVFENVEKIGASANLKGVSVYGGTGYEKQKEGFRNKVDFVVATPGRLIDLYKDNILDLKQVKALVFDEADRMFDMGFKDDMKFLLSRIPKERQLMVFSATMNLDVMTTVYQFGSDPTEINISKDATKADNVKDELFHVGQEEKPQILFSLLNLHKPKQAIVFTNFKNNVERIAQFLIDNGIPAVPISSLLSQSQRNKVMELFKEVDNQYNIMVATDVAARGLDIKGVDMVVNFELPQDCESYVHRIGRTGRAGQMGQAFSLVSDRDVDSLQRIEDYLQQKVPVGFLDDTQITKPTKDFPDYVKFNQTFGFLKGADGGGRENREGRNDGPRNDRGRREPRGRHEGGRAEGGRHDSGRREGPRNNRNENAPRESRPRREDGRPDLRLSREEREIQAKQFALRNEGKPAQQSRRPNSKEGNRPQGKNQGPKRPASQNQGKRPHQQNRASGKSRTPAQSKGVVQKVSQFFKKLFN
jgi:superfamily II DNA/RNA helicase